MGEHVYYLVHPVADDRHVGAVNAIALMPQQLSGFKPHLNGSVDLAKAADHTLIQQTLALADEHN
tara:strand:+ start:372 stop:566 length:195 start_codon:yes stop_codon:yes gene_type:complete